MELRNETSSRRRQRREEAGFSLLEMLVAVAIFTIVTGAIYSLLAVGQSDAFHTKQRTETMQNARISLNTIGRDAVNAGVGYWKFGASCPDGTLQRLLWLPGETDGLLDVLTPVVPGNNVRSMQVDGRTVPTDVITFVYQDNSFNNGQSLQVTAVSESNGRVTVAPNNSVCTALDRFVYLIDDGNAPALGSLTALRNTNQIVFEQGRDPLRLNAQGANTPFAALNDSASCRLITWVTYFVNDDGILMRREYGQVEALVGEGVEDGGAGGVVPEDTAGAEFGFVEMPLAYGVEDFQIRYVMNDGSTVDDVLPYSYVDESGQTVVEPAYKQRPGIRLVIVSLTMRSPEADRVTGEPIRVTVTGSFHTPNLVVPERPGGRPA